MGGKSDFLSEDELAQLRMEAAALAGEDDQNKGSKEQEDVDIIEEMLASALTIEENGSYVKIDDEGMNAWLYLEPPALERDNYTMDELISFLESNGIKTGYHQSNLAAMIKKRVYHREILVAKGQPAIEGYDGYFEYKFDPDSYRAPKVLANGRVDYTNMSTLPNVRSGDVVAVYHHARMGQDGYDIRGKAIPAQKVKEVPPLRGQSISNQDNPDIYVATKDGKIEYKDGRIDIQALHEINGDVTLITGKIEFYGDVVINGNVEAGVVIRAGRNIEIRGSVEAVNLFAGGDIILGRGIQGAQKAKVSARGNVFADFIEHTVVMAGGTVQANTIMNSRISADDQVILTGKKGAIIGGYTHAAMGITATEIGNVAEVRTVVHAGCEKEVFQRHQEVRKKEVELAGQFKERYEEFEQLRRKLISGIMKPTDASAIKLKTLEQEIRALKKEQDENKKECQDIEDLMVKRQNAEIAVSGNIYRGTVVCFAQVQIPIEHNTCFMKYFYQRGMIDSSVIAYS